MNVSGRTFINRVLSSKFAFVWLLLIPTIPHFIYRIFLDAQFPTTHDLINDWANHAHSFTYLLFGFVLARESSFHLGIDRIGNIVMVFSVSKSSLYLDIYNYLTLICAKLFIQAE